MFSKDSFSINTSKNFTRKEREAVKYLRSLHIKIEKMREAKDDYIFRKKFTNQKLLTTGQIPDWLNEIDYKIFEVEFERIASKFGFDTKDEKNALLDYLLMGVIISSRSLDYGKKSQKPKLAGLKWDMFFRDKLIMKRRSDGKTHNEIADEFGLYSGEADSWNITHRYRKRLSK